MFSCIVSVTYYHECFFSLFVIFVYYSTNPQEYLLRYYCNIQQVC